VSADAILLTHAEVSIALAGFATVVAALRQPLSSIERHRFIVILLTSLTSVLNALVPVWLSESGVVGPTLWRTASAVCLALAVVVTLITVIPLRTLDHRARIIINLPVTILANVLFLVLIVLLVLNLWGVSEARFSLYYAALLATLTSAFMVFADSILNRDD
jgi:hypothetical protein